MGQARQPLDLTRREPDLVEALRRGDEPVVQLAQPPRERRAGKGTPSSTATHTPRTIASRRSACRGRAFATARASSPEAGATHTTAARRASAGDAVELQHAEALDALRLGPAREDELLPGARARRRRSTSSPGRPSERQGGNERGARGEASSPRRPRRRGTGQARALAGSQGRGSRRGEDRRSCRGRVAPARGGRA